MPKVRDAIRLVERDGWMLARIVGSHRQYRHPTKPGTVTIPGTPGKDLPPGTWHSILQASGIGIGRVAMRYVVVYEQSPNNWSAYVPDLPGCVAAGDTREETEQLIQEAVALHVESLRAHHEAVPSPGTWTGVVEVQTDMTATASSGRQRTA
jgi:predicted RNA binding protein YcfA (HicA-like mRNA interferase family)/predicted RNase H-like HicB family nuclease